MHVWAYFITRCLSRTPEIIFDLHMRDELESRETPQGSIMLVTNPLGTHRTGIFDPCSSLHATSAITNRHSGESPPLWLRRREYPWTDRTFLTGLPMFSFVILKNFSRVLGNRPLWSCFHFKCDVCVPLGGLFTPNLQHVKGNWRQRVRGK